MNLLKNNTKDIVIPITSSLPSLKKYKGTNIKI